MRKVIGIFAAFAFAMNAQAQTLADGVKMYKYERYKSAQSMLAPFADKDPIANYYLGLSQLGAGLVTDANNTFSKFPEDPANMSGLARVAFVKNNPTEGARLAKLVADKAKKKEWEPLRYAADAITYTDGGDNQQAITWYKSALEKSDDADIHIGLGDAYQKIQGGGGEAMNNYEHITEKDAKNSLAFSRIGALWYAAHNYPSALDNYGKAKNADSTNPIPYRDLANAYERSGSYDLAYQNIKRYYDLSDKSVDDQVNLVDIMYLSKRYDEAIKGAQQLLSSGVTNKPGIYGILAYSQMENGDSTDALTNTRIYFSKQDPKKIYPADYLNYGKLALKLNLLDTAGYYYAKALDADTSQNKTEIYRQVAEAFKDAKEYAKSAEWYNKLVKANPATQPLDYFWRGAMYYYAKDYSNAATSFQEMETKYPDQPSATYWRGRSGAALDPDAKQGTAAPYFIKWINAVGADPTKKNDMILAEEYLLLYYYNTNDKPDEKTWKEKLDVLNPADDLIKQINEAEKSSSAPKKTTTTKKSK